VSDIPDDHPRAASLRLRERIERHRETGLVAPAGPIAHGRGEAFDYLLGEATPPCVEEDIRAAAALLLEAERPVISVNGNAAALVPAELAELGRAVPAPLEVNVFYGRTSDRERLIADHLKAHGAKTVLGVEPTAKVPRLTSARGWVDREGIARADLVLVLLEDGDRTRALLDWGKRVISVDLNPLSRTARDATLNLCDNIVRAVPKLTEAVRALQGDPLARRALIAGLDGRASTRRVLEFLAQRLLALAADLGAPGGDA
jgi:4-phosphopantoate--beta-alanine ligase